MKIQLITNGSSIQTSYDIEKITFSEPKSFDSFDVNIIDLQTPNLWVNENISKDQINILPDLKSLKKIIANTKNYVIISLPQNYTFLCNKYLGEYKVKTKLKDMISNLKGILAYLLPEETKLANGYRYELIFENSTTKCNKSEFSSAFWIKQDFSKFSVITRALDSENATTINIKNKIYLTTLDLRSKGANIDDFLLSVGIQGGKANYPKWLHDVNFFDDEAQKSIIEKNVSTIKRLQDEIDNANKKLNDNLLYKSILVTNGNELVKMIFEILQKLFSYDLSEFKDEKKEDFLIKLKDVTFIGEIKGVTSNVKSENVSQVDVHYNSYCDKLREFGDGENVKALLIINSQRNKDILERDEVHEIQIKLAERNGSLIIPTLKLLKIFENFIIGKTTSEKIIQEFSTQTGLIDVNKII